MSREPPVLYPGLLGPAWNRLHPGIRAAHSMVSGSQRSGLLQVEVGSGTLARIARLVLRIPSRNGEHPARLSIHHHDNAEIWERVIGSWRFSTRQWAHHGILRERYGPLHFDLRLGEIEGGLRYSQIGLRFALGPLSVIVPRALAVRVIASEQCTPDRRATNLAVRVELPIVGLLVAYRGVLGSR